MRENELIAAQKLMIEDLTRRNRGYHKALQGLLGLLRTTKVSVVAIQEALRPAFDAVCLDRQRTGAAEAIEQAIEGKGCGHA